MSRPAEGDAVQFPHGADIGVHGQGATRTDAFSHVAVALAAAMVDPDSLPKQKLESLRAGSRAGILDGHTCRRVGSIPLLLRVPPLTDDIWPGFQTPSS